MRIAFLIQAHDQPLLAARLVNRLAEVGDVFLHVDGKVDEAPFRRLIDKAVFVADRVSVKWGCVSQVEALMALIRCARTHGDYDYFSHHSGTDYPIGSLESFKALLATHKGEEFMECYPIPAGNRYRFERFNLVDIKDNVRSRVSHKDRFLAAIERIVGRLIKRRMYRDWPACKGSCWMTITEDLATGAQDFWDGNADVRRFFKTVLCPDEHYVHCFAAAQGFASRISKLGYLRHIAWTKPESSSPHTLAAKDYGDIVASGAFFARKFCEDNPEILDMLDEHAARSGLPADPSR